MISEIPQILTSNCSHCWFKRWARAASFLQDTPWNVKEFREMRLWIILVSVGDRTIKLCIDETGDEKKELQLIM